jgi:hypothetical protein
MREKLPGGPSRLREPAASGTTRRGARLHRWLSLGAADNPVPALAASDFRTPETSMWATSPERTWYLGRRARLLPFVAAGVLLAGAAAWLGQPPRSDTRAWWAAVLGAVAAVVLGWCAFPYCAARSAFRERRRTSAAARAELALQAATSPAEGEALSLPALFAYNRRQLDAYQDESRRQQRLAFRHAQAAALAGLGVLVVGIASSLRQGPGSSAYVVAGLSGLGAVLSGYVADVFLRAARRADEQLTLFYGEPHMTGRVLLAECLIDRLCADARDERGRETLAQLLAWPLPEVSPGAAREPERAPGSG